MPLLSVFSSPAARGTAESVAFSIPYTGVKVNKVRLHAGNSSATLRWMRLIIDPVGCQDTEGMSFSTYLLIT